MREIKFRGKRLYENKDWKYGFYYIFKDNIGKEFHNILNDEEEVTVNQYGSTVPVFTNVDKNTLGQYTGLHDKNGKEIYEGDIVEIKTRIDNIVAKIEWDEAYLSYVIITEDVRYFNENLGDFLDYNIEVIGNIYDNPELLKEEY